MRPWVSTAGVGEYVSIARRKGDTWYVGRHDRLERPYPDHRPRLPGRGRPTPPNCSATASTPTKAARDYKRESIEIPADRKLTVKMAPGGGFALKISRK